jgi:hypothetical protein
MVVWITEALKTCKYGGSEVLKYDVDGGKEILHVVNIVVWKCWRSVNMMTRNRQSMVKMVVYGSVVARLR